MGSASSAIGSSMGDLFYPGNPKRRIRADQLYRDCNTINDLFESEKKNIDQLEHKVRDAMNTYMTSHGFKTADELHARVEQILNGDALRNWMQLKQATGHLVEDILMTTIGIATILTGVLAGGLLIAGVISGGAAWAAFGAGMAVSAILGGIVALAAIIQGAEERDNLREAIDKLAFARVDLQVQLLRARVLTQYYNDFIVFFNNPHLADQNIFDEEFGKLIRRDMSDASRQAAIQELERLDKSRDSWRDGDPNVTNPRGGQLDSAEGDDLEIPPQSSLKVTKPDTTQFVLDLQYIESSTPLDCVAKDVKTDDEWELHANLVPTTPPTPVKLESVRFRLTEKLTGLVHDDCSIEILSLSTV
ncbi:hypothetical protein FB567DRAFT_613252 [Paraphoma chrysanthemicola]|uniref:Uncharacterized protein n=1 Tax=Paraphoma chrysanthemicola TaxID=798071 RepID=A0A8K0QTI6_9PLEO|nr:hypothetical protein FB567DRAFT_613252 [Paraphoma chrysanthemicola]